jgi:PadR family transcriptional regulator, regulatory protein AphA
MKSAKQLGGTTASALLGLLTLHPMSGYDMRALIDRSIGHFWSESYGQIYPTLKRLAAAGLVEKKTERQKGKPDRNVFSITAAGREQLEEWLKLPPAPEVPRSELLLKLFFGHHVPAPVNREHIAALLSAHQGALKQYAAIEKQLRREEADDPQLPYWLMTVSFGRHRSNAFVRWAKESLETIDRLEETTSRSKSRTATRSR